MVRFIKIFYIQRNTKTLPIIQYEEKMQQPNLKFLVVIFLEFLLLCVYYEYYYYKIAIAFIVVQCSP